MCCSAPYNDAAKTLGALQREACISAPDHPRLPLSSVAILLAGQQLESGHSTRCIYLLHVGDAQFNVCGRFSRKAALRRQEFGSSCKKAYQACLGMNLNWRFGDIELFLSQA